MAERPPRDDDPPHPNFDGIYFQATTDKAGVIATPAAGQTAPPISYLPIPVAMVAAADLAHVIERIRKADVNSYLAAFLEDMLDDFSAAIEACREEKPH